MFECGSNAWLNGSVSDNSNNNPCVCQEMIRFAMLRKHNWSDFCK